MKKLIFAVFLLVVIVSFSCSDYSDLRLEVKAEKTFFKLNKVMADITINPRVVPADNYADAISRFRDIINKYGEAQQKSLRIKNMVERSWLSISTLHLLQKKYQDAKRSYDEIISSNPSNQSLCASAQFSKALMFEKLGKLDTALVEYEIFLDNYQSILGAQNITNQKYIEIPLKIARLHRVMEHKNYLTYYENAKKYYSDLTLSYPDVQLVSSIYHLLATAYADLLDWQSALTTLNSLVSEYPDTTREPFVLYEVGNIYKNQLGRTEEALEVYKDIQKKYPEHFLNASVNLSIGDIYYKNENYDETRNYYLKVIDKHSNNIAACSKAQFGIGLTYEKQNEWGKALNELRWIWTNYPLSSEAIITPNYIANYYKKSGNKTLADESFKDAVDKYQKFYEQYNKNELASVSLLQMSISFANLDKWQDAVETLKKVLGNHADSPLIPEVYIRLANIYEDKIKQNDRALQFYEVFVDRFPNHPFAGQVSEKINLIKKL